MAKRYAIFSARFDPLVGGIESYTASVSAELVRNGDDVTVVTSRLDDSPVEELRPDGVRVVRLPARSLVDGRLPLPQRNGEYRGLLDSVCRRGVDRVIVNARFYPHSIDGLKVAQAAGCRALLVDHGSAYLSLGTPIADALIARYEHHMTERTKLFDPVYGGVSQKSVEWLKTFGIQTANVIPNAIDAPAFRDLSSGRDFRSKFGVSEEDMLVVFIGRLAPEKGAAELLDAVTALKGFKMHVVFAGDGAQGASLKARAPENAHFAGLLGKADVSALLQQADVFCLPTRSEGFCTALLEASACGVPAIITDVGGVAELIPDSSMGIVLPERTVEYVAGGLEVALSLGPSGRAAMGERARARVEDSFTWAGTVDKIEAVFDETESPSNADR